MLEKYARDNGFDNVLFLADDGYTGTNFERPSWKQIEDMIKRGEVETLIVKDYCAIIGLNQKDLETQGILA